MEQPAPASRIDLRGTPCPLNFIRSRLALEALRPGEWLQVDLDAGEPDRMVAEGLRQAGHRVERVEDHLPPRTSADAAAVRLLVRRHGA
jgi:TusA-related sulfurtransferase